MSLPTSKLTKNQKIKIRVENVRDEEYGIVDAPVVITIRFDDECGNGHNTFSVTASGRGFGGCVHDLIARIKPELAPFIKWHLCSTDGPMHYIANTTYHARSTEWNGSPKEPDIAAARSSAIWPGASLEQLQDEAALRARLPELMQQFKADMESLGFTY